MSPLLRRALAALTILVLTAGACGNSGDDDTGSGPTGGSGGTDAPSGEEERDTFVALEGVPGVTDDEIGFAVIGTKSGNPLGTCLFDCYLAGIEAYFAYRNSEGGIYGRDLVVSQELDDGLVNNQAKSLEVVSSDEAFGAFQATLLASGWGDLNDAGIPTYAWGIHATEAANRPAVFPSTVIRCSDCLGKTIPWEVKEVGATKVAALGYGVSENSKVCTNTIADAMEKYGDDAGAEIAYVNDELPYGLGGGAERTVVTAMKDADVDFVATCMDLNGMKKLAQELERQGMGDVTMHHPNTYNQAFVTEAGDLFEGDFVGVGFRPFEAEQEGTALSEFVKWMDQTGGEVTELAMHGWINATLAFEGLLAAGPEFDREKVIAATNGITEFDAGGLIETVDWTTAHSPYTDGDRPDDEDPECTALVRVVDGTFETVGPPDKPWLCFPAGDELTEPEPTSFG